MSEAADREKSLSQRILSGDNRKLQMLAAEGVLPLPPEELIAVQVALTRNADAKIAERATESLEAVEPPVIAEFLASHGGEAELVYFANNSDHPVVLEAVLQRREVPYGLLTELAGWLAPQLQEVLLLRQDAILKEPAILDALATNPELSTFARRRIAEYREHLLPKEVEGLPAEESSTEAIPVEEITEEELELALDEVRELPAQGEVDQKTGLSESQIRALAIPMRLKLSRGASRTLRGILVRDTNPQVATSVLNHSAFSEQEVEQICHSRTVIEDVLEAITRRREWVSKYPITVALVRNPRTPVGIAVRLAPRLSVRDLRSLSGDHNVPDSVRSTAARLYKIKSR